MGNDATKKPDPRTEPLPTVPPLGLRPAQVEALGEYASHPSIATAEPTGPVTRVEFNALSKRVDDVAREARNHDREQRISENARAEHHEREYGSLHRAVVDSRDAVNKGLELAAAQLREFKQELRNVEQRREMVDTSQNDASRDLAGKVESLASKVGKGRLLRSALWATAILLGPCALRLVEYVITHH